MKQILVSALLWCLAASAQQRPRLVGISHIAVRVKDLNAARHFYGDLLGYQEAFTVRKDHTAVIEGGLPQDQVNAVFFKVNNRQYIVVMPETSPDQPRYVDAAIETDDVEAMRLYLRSIGYAAPDKVERTPTHDLAFHIKDPDGNSYEIMQYTPESLSVRTVGKFLGDQRASHRILHVGISITKQETADFYLKGFSLREFWRADPSMSQLGTKTKKAPPPGPLYANLSNLKLPEGDDYIEWSLSHGQSANKKGPASGGGHIALLVDDMAKAVEFVKAKPAWKDYARAAQQEAHTGVNHKWQGNFFDPDGTRSEFMEPDTADGLPSPMSHAPYYPASK
ncbi:MAG TPA: VOC family protein [Bryobacteraceae bacterium]|jgi:catechol 2,3-dioxygenase-like lactoylglutathione lyase family enzyme|nr:VOC family protein [Bryobacteraceae bacterium]